MYLCSRHYRTTGTTYLLLYKIEKQTLYKKYWFSDRWQKTEPWLLLHQFTAWRQFSGYCSCGETDSRGLMRESRRLEFAKQNRIPEKRDLHRESNFQFLRSEEKFPQAFGWVLICVCNKVNYLRPVKEPLESRMAKNSHHLQKAWYSLCSYLTVTWNRFVLFEVCFIAFLRISLKQTLVEWF